MSYYPGRKGQFQAFRKSQMRLDSARISCVTRLFRIFLLLLWLFKCANPINCREALSKQVYFDVFVGGGTDFCVGVRVYACVSVALPFSPNRFGLCFVALNLQYLKLSFLSQNKNQQTVNCFVRDLKPNNWRSEWELLPDGQEPYCYRTSGAFSSSFSQLLYWPCLPHHCWAILICCYFCLCTTLTTPPIRWKWFFFKSKNIY